MRTGILIVLALFAAASQAFSQTPCTNQDAYNKPGVWNKQGGDDLAEADRSFPAAQYQAALAKSQKVIDLLKQANPELKGMDAVAMRMIRGDSYVPNGALKFGAAARYNKYLCTPMTVANAELRGKLVIGSDDRITVKFNDLSALLDRVDAGSDTLLTAGGETIYWFSKPLGDFKGMPLFVPAADIFKGSSTVQSEVVIIAPPNRLTYKFLTRAKYLEAREGIYKTQINSMQKQIKDIQAGKDKKLAEIDSSSMTAAQKAQMKQIYLQSIQQMQDSIEKQTKEFETLNSQIETALNGLSSADRASSAVVRDLLADPTKGKMFATEAEGGRRMVTIDNSYFNSALPRPAIQLITVNWSWDTKQPAEAEWMRLFKQNFDFGALRGMLEK